MSLLAMLNLEHFIPWQGDCFSYKGQEPQSAEILNVYPPSLPPLRLHSFSYGLAILVYCP